ncbi:MAG: tRNA (adenosine(37)-N6)-threonylcarbamoyltransferase complex ATPase subunit type 1 TsaE [Clostridia bacterium]|nr:tRNA (adenosine(37)-N6)-threonylcarbamoyltransferase complex ATPase subunit type 1 TsaE [Clostridia bacterium]MDO5303018.1 tRNA (adenosine(37)-N6)-threonylcarbamoyltransferase complex ATPase subunit type 1 TsaE [Clostridia bacterium]
MREVLIKNEEDTRAFGLELAKNLKPNTVVALIGDLGTGKTTLSKYIAEGLGVKETITSPTFTVVLEYHSGRLPFYHFDVYRVNDPDDLFEIGAEEYFYKGGVSVVEWADQVAEILPDDTLCIFIEYGEKEGERIYKCTF